jgi:hypothetical protein
MHGFITDWANNHQGDTRITSEFIAYIYDVICCRHLNESIDMLLTANGFFIYELEEYLEKEYIDVRPDQSEVLAAHRRAEERCMA